MHCGSFYFLQLQYLYGLAISTELGCGNVESDRCVKAGSEIIEEGIKDYLIGVS